ncbi:hypothetical protein CXG81DRAFT_11188 [Caulochytrium protostelioides]|uniref:U3 small nucleolar RNA-associated protein 13 C-terminal domain-containing protein n=1 Tax=Caulochytrium protostelioides TaxID=1555241 RepID=A0A4P9X9V4_9FUNG|nr:hypothetical protein CXG81DRAFT_11188 [Caulochytrium protostelioides]|eukprot:RKP02095.1 hypothetical protein CXG81DRAFT_11188 [Caulochytrium protostelioides]
MTVTTPTAAPAAAVAEHEPADGADADVDVPVPPPTALKSHFKAVHTQGPVYSGGNVSGDAMGHRLVSTVAEHVATLDAATGRTIATTTLETDVTCVQLMPDGHLLAVASNQPLLTLWDATTVPHTKKRSIKAHTGVILTMAADPTSTLLATGSADSEVKVWDADDGFCTHHLTGHHGVISALAFHPDPQRLLLLSGANDCAVRVWDLRRKACIHVFEQHTSVLRGLAFDLRPDATIAYSTGHDQFVHAFDFVSGALVRSIPAFEEMEGMQSVPAELVRRCVARATDPAQVVMTVGKQGLLRLWDMATGTELARAKSTRYADAPPLTGGFVALASHRFVTVSYDHNLAFYSLGDDATFTQTKQLVGYNDTILDLVFMAPRYTADRPPAAATAAGLGTAKLALASNSEQVRLMDTATGHVELLEGHTKTAICLAVDHTGTRLASGGRDALGLVWMADPGAGGRLTAVARAEGHGAAIGAIAFGWNAATLYTGAQDQTLKCWALPQDLAAPAHVAATASLAERTVKLVSTWTLVAHAKDINAVAVAPNDRLVASASQDRSIKLWRTDSGALVHTLKGHKRGVWSIAFSATDQVLLSASGDQTVRLWSVSDGACLRTFEGHLNSVLKVHFVSGGLQFLSASSDGLLKLWNIKDAECVATLEGHDEKVWAVAVHPSEALVVSGGSDSQLVFWENTTATVEHAAAKQEQWTLEQEQNIANHVARRDYPRALRACLRLDKPNAVMGLLKDVLLSAPSPDEADAVLMQLLSHQDPATQAKLVRYVCGWIARPRTAPIAGRVLQILLRAYPPDVSPEAEMNPTANGNNLWLNTRERGDQVQLLLAASKKQFDHANKAVRQAHLLDYVMAQMDQLLE